MKAKPTLSVVRTPHFARRSALAVAAIGFPLAIATAASGQPSGTSAIDAPPLFDLPYLLEHAQHGTVAVPASANTPVPAHVGVHPKGAGALNFAATGMHFKACCFATSVASADFTGQGRADLVTGNGMSYDISVLISNGIGGYFDPVSLPLDNPAFGYVVVATGDVTGDGKPDIVATGFDTDSILVYAGDGIGNFSGPTRFSTGAQTPRAIALADVTGDGVLDILTTNGDTGNVSVLVGDGSGGFADEVTYAAGSYPNALAVGDVNGDGKPDVVTASGDTLDVSVLIGDGAGHFAAPVSVSIGDNAEPRAVTLADVNGDGKLDIVTANAGSDGSPFPPPELAGSVSILLNDGSGGFAAAVQKSAGPGDGRADAVAVADITGDGHPDIILSRPIANTAAILAGDGAGGFADAVVLPTGIGPSPLTIADATGDGHPDIVTGNQVGSNVSILPSDGEGGIGFRGNFGAGTYPHSVVTVDLNDDGHADVVTANAMGNDVSVLLGDGFGGFSAEVHYPVGSSPTWIATGDFNEDGHPDIVTADLGGGTVSVLLGDGTGGFGAAASFSVAPGFESPYAVAIGDANEDGHLDLATANTNISNESISLLLGDGTGSFGTATTLPVGNSDLHVPESVLLTDVTGDGHADIVTANLNSSDLSVLAGDGTGSFAAAVSVPTDVGPVVVAAGDVNGDGVVDLVTVNQTAQSVSVLIGEGGGTFAASANYPIYPDETVQDYMPWPWGMTLADVTGDGMLDIVTANTQNDTVSVLPNDGAGGFGTFFNFDSGAHPGSVAVADINEDGKVDIVTSNRDNNNISVLFNEAQDDSIFRDGFDIVPIL